ncbi:MAG TPA: lysylphosphatidylglycerol synthase transmembrane domain-containing protein [Thermomicrobiales bacterium]|nr:lysylphosphatidylglycerol synthase transmembrane domain-containing protein [Thermomicrobiales bacterium]
MERSSTIRMRSWRVWAGLLVSLVFIYFALRNQDFGHIWQALREAEYGWLIPAVAVYFLGVMVRSVRWHYLLRAVQDIPPRRLFPIVVIGYMANNILPLRAGEVVRSYALSARFGVSKSSSLATIAIERIFDGLTMLAFIAVASLSVALTGDLWTIALVALLLFPLLMVALIAFVRVAWLRDTLVSLGVRALPGQVAPRVEALAHSFVEGLGILKRRQDLLGVGLTSVLAWLLEASMYLLIAQGFNLDLSPAAVLMVTAVANMATLIPASPGYVGPFETGVLLVLNGALGISRALALSYAIVVHAALYFPVTVLGLIYWWRESFSWRDAQQAEEAIG